jgi:hypothetical protein
MLNFDGIHAILNLQYVQYSLIDRNGPFVKRTVNYGTIMGPQMHGIELNLIYLVLSTYFYLQFRRK